VRLICFEGAAPTEAEQPERKAREAWMAGAEFANPQLYEDNEVANVALAAFAEWWKRQIDQCLYVFSVDEELSVACVLKNGHDGDHAANEHAAEYVRPDEAWISPENLAWRRKHGLEQ
jgi:hypothetical protein